MIRLELPWPPSVNLIWRSVKGRVLLSREGREYRRLVGNIVMIGRHPSMGRSAVKMTVDAYMPDNRRRDIDNLNKAACDALQAARVFEDDSQIVELHIRKAGIDRNRPRLDVTLEAV